MEASRDAVLLRLPRVGRFLVRVQDPVAVERAPGAGDADLRCFLEGPVAAARALLRGALPLHAACVSIRGRAVALAGGALAGKSAVAAALALRGHPVLADAVTVVEPGRCGRVEPLAPRPVLWPDVVDDLGLDPGAGEPVRPSLPQRSFELNPARGSAPLGALAVITRDPRLEVPHIAPLSGWSKAIALMAATWHRRLIEPLGIETGSFGPLSEAAAGVEAFSVVRPRDGCSARTVAASIEERMG